MSDEVRAAAIALYDRYTHEGLDRRAFMAELTRIAGSSAAAGALLAGIAADSAAAAVVASDDPRIRVSTSSEPLEGRRDMGGYLAMPAKRPPDLRHDRPWPKVMIIHENRGLNEHIRDVARRFAVAGYYAWAPDFLWVSDDTPSPEDPDKARAEIAALDLSQAVADGLTMIRRLREPQRVVRPFQTVTNPVGIVGFCWGGGMVNRLAVAAGADLTAAVSFYGPAPAEAAKVVAPMQIHLAGRDERVNKTALPWVTALRTARKTVEAHTYTDVEHALHNDTSAERYNPAAAKLAWDRTLSFFGKFLRGPPA